MGDADDKPDGTGVLYVVATPIGNLEDISLRALRILREADLIAAEDTRVTRKLLSHFDIHTPLTSYHQHSLGTKARQLAERLARGQRLAVVADAGTPGVSDPGLELVRLAIDLGVPVIPVPGPVAAAAALSASGLSAQRFVFDGFPPRQKKNRVAFFQRLAGEERTVALYESPRRTVETLRDLLAVLGDRHAVVGRELTKRFEEFVRGPLSEVLRRFEECAPQGEVVILLEGSASPEVAEVPDPPAEGSTRDIARALRAQGVSRQDAYRRALRLHSQQEEGEPAGAESDG